jgi:hypothetical protein
MEVPISYMLFSNNSNVSIDYNLFKDYISLIDETLVENKTTKSRSKECNFADVNANMSSDVNDSNIQDKSIARRLFDYLNSMRDLYSIETAIKKTKTKNKDNYISLKVLVDMYNEKRDNINSGIKNNFSESEILMSIINKGKISCGRRDYYINPKKHSTMKVENIISDKNYREIVGDEDKYSNIIHDYKNSKYTKNRGSKKKSYGEKIRYDIEKASKKYFRHNEDLRKEYISRITKELL